MSPPALPPLFRFLRALTFLHCGQAGNGAFRGRPASALRELLGDHFPSRLAEGAAGLAGLGSGCRSFAGAAFPSDAEALAGLIDQLAAKGTEPIQIGAIDGFTPDETWLGPARATSRGFRWEVKLDLLTRQMIEELPKGDPAKARWKRGQISFASGNPVEIRSRILSTVSNASVAAAHKARATMKGGLSPLLRSHLELVRGPRPTLELRITWSRRDREVFGLLQRRLSGEGSRVDRFAVRLGDKQVPKRIRLSLPGGTHRGAIRAGWEVFRAWIETVQLPPAPAEAAANRRQWREYNKVRRFRISDPFLGFLVAKFENAIDWRSGRIRDERSLAREVRVKHVRPLLGRLKALCDPAQYAATDDRFEAHLQRDGNTLSALVRLQMFREFEAPEQVIAQARRRFLACLIAEKVGEIKRWVNYLTRENPVYRENPALQFLVLDFVARSSGPGTVNPPVKLNPEALALLQSAILDGRVRPTDNLRAKYKVLTESATTADHLPEPTRWLVFEGKRWLDEAAMLATHSHGSGWCVAAEYHAENYLRHSSFFHLLKVKGRPRVALRLVDGAIVETQGNCNGDPGEYWPRVLLYTAIRRLPFHLEPKNSNPRGRAARAAAEQGRAAVGGLDAVALAARLRESPYDVQFVSEQRLVDPALREAIAEAWRVIIDEYPAVAAIAPEGFGRDAKLHGQLRSKMARQTAIPGTFLWEPWVQAGNRAAEG